MAQALLSDSSASMMQALLSDLSARTPYGVKIWYKYAHWEGHKYCTSISIPEKRVWISNKKDRMQSAIPVVEAGEILIKPYLRSIDDLTETEKDEYDNLLWAVNDFVDDISNLEPPKKLFDWLNEYQIDYRGFIEQGIALPAEEGTYNFK